MCNPLVSPGPRPDCPYPPLLSYCIRSLRFTAPWLLATELLIACMCARVRVQPGRNIPVPDALAASDTCAWVPFGCLLLSFLWLAYVTYDTCSCVRAAWTRHTLGLKAFGLRALLSLAAATELLTSLHVCSCLCSLDATFLCLRDQLPLSIRIITVNNAVQVRLIWGRVTGRGLLQVAFRAILTEWLWAGYMVSLCIWSQSAALSCPPIAGCAPQGGRWTWLGILFISFLTFTQSLLHHHYPPAGCVPHRQHGHGWGDGDGLSSLLGCAGPHLDSRLPCSYAGVQGSAGEGGRGGRGDGGEEQAGRGDEGWRVKAVLDIVDMGRMRLLAKRVTISVPSACLLYPLDVK